MISTRKGCQSHPLATGPSVKAVRASGPATEPSVKAVRALPRPSQATAKREPWLSVIDDGGADDGYEQDRAYEWEEADGGRGHADGEEQSEQEAGVQEEERGAHGVLSGRRSFVNVRASGDRTPARRSCYSLSTVEDSSTFGANRSRAAFAVTSSIAHDVFFCSALRANSLRNHPRKRFGSMPSSAAKSFGAIVFASIRFTSPRVFVRFISCRIANARTNACKDFVNLVRTNVRSYEHSFAHVRRTFVPPCRPPDLAHRLFLTAAAPRSGLAARFRPNQCRIRGLYQEVANVASRPRAYSRPRQTHTTRTPARAGHPRGGE